MIHTALRYIVEYWSKAGRLAMQTHKSGRKNKTIHTYSHKHYPHFALGKGDSVVVKSRQTVSQMNATDERHQNAQNAIDARLRQDTTYLA